MRKKWTAELDAKLSALWATDMDSNEIATKIGIDVGGVKSRAKMLKIYRPKVWPKEKVAALREMYANDSNQDIAKALDLSCNSIGIKAYRLGLKKSANHISKICKTRNCSFKKGHIPANKGVKGWGANIPNSGRFKANFLPHNTKHNEWVSLRFTKGGRPNLFIRVAVSVWIPYAHWVFQSFYGEVPNGKIIRHKNGNNLDNRLENLECISRQENGIRNTGSQSLSDSYVAATMRLGKEVSKVVKRDFPEVIELKRNILKAKRQWKEMN